MLGFCLPAECRNLVSCFSTSSGVETSNIDADLDPAWSSLYYTLCETNVYASSLTAYGCNTVALSLNAVPLSLTPYTPTASSSSTALTSSPTSSSALQTTPSTSHLVGPTIPSAAASSPSNAPPSFSAEDKVGIGVGVPLGALLILVILLIIIFRKRLFAGLNLRWPETPGPPNMNRKSGLSNLSTGTHQDPVELTVPPGTQIYPWQPHPAQHYDSHELSDYQEVAYELPVERLTPPRTTGG